MWWFHVCTDWWNGIEWDLRGGECWDSSASGLFGNLMPRSTAGGDCESRDKGNDEICGELKDVGGADPDDEYTETLSSQSLLAPEELLEEIDARRSSGGGAAGSFFTFGEGALACFRALFPARSSSKRSGRGRKCVRSYRPHLLHTILPGFNVERRHEGGSVVWQLKQRRRRY